MTSIVNQGSVNTTSFLSPDLTIVIVPPSTLTLNSVSSNVVGLVGLASWGPLNQAIQFSGQADYVSKFGQLQARTNDMGTAAYIATQQGAAAFYGVRVSDGTEASATAVVGSTNITFTAKYPGVTGNLIAVTVGNGSKLNSYRFIVAIPGNVSEIYDNIVSTPTTVTATTTALSTSSTTLTVPTAGVQVGMVISGTGITGSPTVASITNGTTLVASTAQTVASGVPLTFTAANNSVWVSLANAINNGQAGRLPSQLVTAVVGSGVVAPSVGTTYKLTGGADGDASLTSTMQLGSNSLPATGMYALSGTGFGILDVVDCTDATKWTLIDQFANSESAYAIQQVASGQTIAQAVTTKQSAGLDSYNSKLMHGDFLYWADPINQTTRLVAPQHFVAGRFGTLSPQLTTVNKQIVGVAGSLRTGLVGNQTVTSPYSKTECDTLALNGIDAVMNPAAANLNIWSCRIGHNSSSNLAIHLDNYPTLTNYIAKTLANGMGLYIGRTIEKQLFHDIQTTLSHFCQVLAGAGLLSDPSGAVPYAVQCDISINPPSQTDKGYVTANVQAKYPSINENFIVNLQGGNTVEVTLASASATS